MVVNELRGEKIDVIRWSPDPATYISNALSPARVEDVRLINPEDRQAHVLVPEDQLSLAIGKEGQNVRLAARLTGWKIDIKDVAKYDVDAEDQKMAEFLEARRLEQADAEQVALFEQKQDLAAQSFEEIADETDSSGASTAEDSPDTAQLDLSLDADEEDRTSMDIASVDESPENEPLAQIDARVGDDELGDDELGEDDRSDDDTEENPEMSIDEAGIANDSIED